MDSVFLDNQLMDEMFKPSQDENPSQFFIRFINLLEGWKTKCKNLHWAAPKKNIHVYLDEFLGVISDYQDGLAEEYQGLLGHMQPNVIKGTPSDVLNAMDGTDPIQELKEAFGKDGIKVFPISAVTGQGLKELLYHVSSLLSNMDSTPVTFETELDVDTLLDKPNEAF